jgi:hypothetical protein
MATRSASLNTANDDDDDDDDDCMECRAADAAGAGRNDVRGNVLSAVIVGAATDGTGAEPAEASKESEVVGGLVMVDKKTRSSSVEYAAARRAAASLLSKSTNTTALGTDEVAGATLCAGETVVDDATEDGVNNTPVVCC